MGVGYSVLIVGVGGVPVVIEEGGRVGKGTGNMEDGISL